MSIEDLSAGFVNLEKVVTRDEAFAADTAAAIQYNADLLNMLVTRVNSLEAATVLSSEGFQKVSPTSPLKVFRRPRTTAPISTRS